MDLNLWNTDSRFLDTAISVDNFFAIVLQMSLNYYKRPEI